MKLLGKMQSRGVELIEGVCAKCSVSDDWLRISPRQYGHPIVGLDQPKVPSASNKFRLSLLP